MTAPMKLTAPIAGRKFFLLILMLLGLLLLPGSVSFAQELNGVRIQVNPDALTILKFNDDIRNFEFGKSDVFTAQVQDGVKLRIKTLTNSPTPTNLTVTEGGRTHVFIIEVVKKIDINTFKSYYDYSDLKTLRKMIAAGNKTATPSPTASEAPDSKATASSQAKISQSETAPRQSKAEAARLKKEQKAREKEEAAVLKKEQEETARRKTQEDQEQKAQRDRDATALREKQQAKEEAEQKAANAVAEKKHLKEEKAAREKAEKEEKMRGQQLERENNIALAAAKKRQQDAEKKKKQEGKEEKDLQASRDREIAAAKEKDRQTLITQENARKAEEAKKQKTLETERQAQKQREDEAARKRQLQLDEAKKEQAAAEKQRVAAEAAARKKEAALEAERKRQEDIARKKQEEVEKEQKRQADLAVKAEQDRIRKVQEEAERQRMKEEKAQQARRDAEQAAQKAQERADALIKNPYWKTEWHKKYPKINFAEIPQGQTITGEYYLPKDTLANNAAALKTMSQPAHLNKKSDDAEGAHMVLESITFSGVNSFFRIKVVNNSAKDFLVGKMMLSWWKKEGGSFYLIPCYVTEFPVIYPGKEATIVYGCRGVNATDNDDFQFSLKERTDDRELLIPFMGNLYNKEMNR